MWTSPSNPCSQACAFIVDPIVYASYRNFNLSTCIPHRDVPFSSGQTHFPPPFPSFVPHRHPLSRLAVGKSRECRCMRMHDGEITSLGDFRRHVPTSKLIHGIGVELCIFLWPSIRLIHTVRTLRDGLHRIQKTIRHELAAFHLPVMEDFRCYCPCHFIILITWRRYRIRKLLHALEFVMPAFPNYAVFLSSVCVGGNSIWLNYYHARATETVNGWTVILCTLISTAPFSPSVFSLKARLMP